MVNEVSNIIRHFAGRAGAGIAIIVMLFAPMQAAALSQAQTDVFNSGIYYFNTDSSSISCSSSSTLVGSDNVQKAFYYFTGKGLSDFQSAGIVGNLMQESGVDPTNVQPNGAGHGIAQWSEPGRWDKLLTYASSQNKSPTDLGLQLDFLWYELSTTYPSVLSNLKTTTNVDVAVNQFVGPNDASSGQPVLPTAEVARSGGYENPGTPIMKNRLQDAHDVLSKYGGASSTGVVPSSSSDCNGPVGTSGNKIVQIALAQVGTHETNSDNDSATCKYQGSGCPPGEEWCADFVSWIYNQAGMPFTGGLDGGWRIPGAAAVADWFKANGIWINNPAAPVPVNDPKAPQPGDLVYYPDNGGHVNIVVSYDGKTVTTVGGNQSDSVSTESFDVFGTAAGWGRAK